MTATDARLLEIMDRLAHTYPDRRPLLIYRSPFELSVAVALSAQTTDAAVNAVTPELFSRWPTPDALANAHPPELETVIHSLGFFRQKAGNLISASRIIVERFAGQVPESMEELTSLPGIGRKSANVIRAHVWNHPGIIVDTHFGRVCRRLGLTGEKQPSKLEFELAALVPKDRQREFSMTANLHGRRYCKARRPECDECPLNPVCPKYGVGHSGNRGPKDQKKPWISSIVSKPSLIM